MTAIILSDVTENQIASIALAFKEQQKAGNINLELDWKAISRSVSESIRDMLEGREDLRQ